MNQSKFSLADVLTVFATIIFGVVSFLGADFLNIGNAKVWGMSHPAGCIVMAIVIALLLGGTAFGAKLLKRTSRNFKTCFIWEIVCLFFFVIFAVFFTTKSSPFPHFFTVQSHKTEIKEKLQTSITQAENMFAAYETYADNRENLYKHKLQSVVAARNTNPAEYKNYGFDGISGVSDASQINTKMFTVHADLFPTNYSDTINKNGIKEVAYVWLNDAKSATNSWHFPIGSTEVVSDIEKKSNGWLKDGFTEGNAPYKSLIQISQVREQGEIATDFAYPLGFDDVKTYYTKIESPSILAFTLAIVVYILILLAYIFTERSSKSSYGFRPLFSSLLSKKEEKTSNNFDIEY